MSFQIAESIAVIIPPVTNDNVNIKAVFLKIFRVAFVMYRDIGITREFSKMVGFRALCVLDRYPTPFQDPVIRFFRGEMIASNDFYLMVYYVLVSF